MIVLVMMLAELLSGMLATVAIAFGAWVAGRYS